VNPFDRTKATRHYALLFGPRATPPPIPDKRKPRLVAEAQEKPQQEENANILSHSRHDEGLQHISVPLQLALVEISDAVDAPMERAV